jgi:ABC-2 type transport system ATP-binding protein
MDAIHLEGLSYRYAATGPAALVDISLTVPVGSFLALLGPNGAGKTTLVHILCGLLSPSAGRAEVLGRATTVGVCRDLIGYCPQDLAVFEPLTAAENLRYFGTFTSIPAPELEARVDRRLAAVGLADHRDHQVGEFSGGMKRRLNLAIAMLADPALLLLDEPTVGIDPQSRNLIFESLEALHRSGTSVVYTTHYMEEAERLCDTIAIIDHGRVLCCGGAEEVKRLGRPPVARVDLDGAVDAALLETLAAVGIAATRSGEASLEIEADGARDLLERLVPACRRHGRGVQSFATRAVSLEDTFLALTGRELRD